MLNFANPVEPGGGVLRGANAQEEYLCRASNLYFSLISEAAKKYYARHNSMIGEGQFYRNFLATDMLIYSPNVTVLKKDVGYMRDKVCRERLEYMEEWYHIDVITCAAPYFTSSENIISKNKLRHLFEKRIKNVFEAAIDNAIDTIILGAWGCGAFHNPPTVVADAFTKVLLKKRYANAFKNVVFAVKRGSAFSENIEAFEIAFSKFPPTGKYVFSAERNKRRFFE